MNILHSAKFIAVAVVAGRLAVHSALALELTEPSGPAHGYPAFREMNGKTLADGEFLQWLEDDRLHIRIIYRFKDGRRIEENGALRQKPEIVQDEWSWRETKGGQVLREFAVNFANQTVTAQAREKDELKHWEEKIEVEPGQTFAGFGFSVALQNLRKRLLHGEHIELKTVGFTPKPQVVTVELSHAGVDRMAMADRSLKGDHFLIHPKVPAIAKLFMKVPDTHIWLTNPMPAGFLRWEGPVAEPRDPIVRVDLLPGGESKPARALKDEAAE